MVIQCENCKAETWCIWIEKDEEWQCQNCFLNDGGTFDEWHKINDAAKERRRMKREGIAETERVEYTKPTYQKSRPCKYECETQLIWDETIQGTNKFVEVDSKLPHTFLRCSEKLKTLGKKLERK